MYDNIGLLCDLVCHILDKLAYLVYYWSWNSCLCFGCIFFGNYLCFGCCCSSKPFLLHNLQMLSYQWKHLIQGLECYPHTITSQNCYKNTTWNKHMDTLMSSYGHESSAFIGMLLAITSLIDSLASSSLFLGYCDK